MTQTDPSKTVFISYRRSINWAHARLVFDELRKRGYDVFMDVENLGSGDFEHIILQEIKARAHFIVMLSIPALKRCSEPQDWLRREIEYAMDNGRNIVPIRIDSFDFKHAKKYLTGKLDRLHRYNGPSLNAEYFDKAIDNLVNRFLVQPVYAPITPPTADTQNEVARIIKDIAAQPEPTRDELSAETFFIRAYEKTENGDFDGAIADYSEVIRLKPNFVQAFNNRGVTRDYKGDLDRAIADYSEAIRLKPDFVEAYCNRGEAHFAQGAYHKAFADFSRVLELTPEDDACIGDLAITYYATGTLVEAQQLWHKLLARDKRYANADWVGKHLDWAEPLIEEARKLIASLNL
jgi:tetratricopeptide (TPR) repeat protein